MTMNFNATVHPTARFRFVDWSMPAAGGEHVFAGFEDIPALIFGDCQFHGGKIYSDYPGVAFTNCLFERVDSAFGSVKGDFLNNTFVAGRVEVDSLLGPHRFTNNFFDGTTLVQNAATTNGYNGYVTNQNRWTPSNNTDVILLSSSYQSGPSGYFYLPTNSLLIDTGHVANAASVGMFYHTVTTNQVREANSRVDIGFHYVGLDTNTLTLTDSDSDGLADFQEDKDSDGQLDSGETNVADTDTDNNGFSDLQDWQLQWNTLVSDPQEDFGSEKNTQSETTLLAFGNTVICAYVDSKNGVTGYGFPANDSCFDLMWNPVSCAPGSQIIQFIGWSVSRDGGATFVDKAPLPLLQPGNKGDGGDPVLARDNSSHVVYLVGNPQRPSIYYPNGTTNPAKAYLPLWRSIDNGETFQHPVNAVPNVAAVNVATDYLDKPALTIDNFPGVGQGDIYVAAQLANGTVGLLISKSDSTGTNWQIMTNFSGSATRASIAVMPNHHICIAWWEGQEIRTTLSTNRGTNFSSPTLAVELINSDHLKLLRFTGSNPLDKFRAPIIPTVMANPARTGELYIVYHDIPTNGTAKPNIYFVQSTNSGGSWSARMQVNVDTNSTDTDQWQPAIAVHPDGSKLFLGWYDRKNDPTDNSLIQIYGTIANIPITDSNSFATNFLISTSQFPPAFTGTNTITGAYDPIYPPLSGFQDSWCCGSYGGNYSDHMGDYDTAVADSRFIYYSWADNRLTCNCGVPRNHADIRLTRLPWNN